MRIQQIGNDLPGAGEHRGCGHVAPDWQPELSDEALEAGADLHDGRSGSPLGSVNSLLESTRESSHLSRFCYFLSRCSRTASPEARSRPIVRLPAWGLGLVSSTSQSTSAS